MDNKESQAGETQGEVITVDIYCRADNAISLEKQEAACRKYAQEQGLHVATVYREASAERVLERRYFKRVRARYKNGETQGFIIDTLDRLTRSTGDFLELQQEMIQHHVMLYCASSDIHTKIFRRLITSFIAATTSEAE